MLGDMLLDNANLNRTEKLLILTSTSNSKKLKDVEEALKKQHPRIHLSENKGYPRKHDDRRAFKDRKEYKKNRQGYRYKKRNFFKKVANLAADYDDYDADDSEDSEEDSGDKDSGQEELKRMARDKEKGNEESGSSDYSWESDCDPDEAYYIEKMGRMYGDAHSEDEEEDCLLREMPEKEAAMVIQHEAVAFLSYSKKGKQNGGKSSGKGKSFGPRFKKGSGKGKKGFRFGFRRNHMSLEERKKKLAELKAKTRCTECNEKGHWAGDDACKLKKKVLQPETPKEGFLSRARSS